MRFDETYDFNDLSYNFHGVGPDSKTVMYWPSETPVTIDPTTTSAFVDHMHELNLQVHPYTLRIDDLKYTDSPAKEIALYATKGCDGVFTEFISTTVAVWEQMQDQG